MDEKFWNTIVTIGTGIIGVAIVAALISPNAQTANVAKAAGGAFSGALGTALSPLTGGGGITEPSGSVFNG